MCSQQSKGAKYPQKSFNCADAFSIKITRFHAALKPIFRSLKPFQAFSSILNLGARDFSFYMNTHTVSSLFSCTRCKFRRISSAENPFQTHGAPTCAVPNERLRRTVHGAACRIFHICSGSNSAVRSYPVRRYIQNRRCCFLR